MLRRPLLLLFLLSLACAFVCPWIVEVQTTTFNIAGGASVGTINSTIASAASTSGNVTVQFGAGNYSINGTVNVPCPIGTMTIQGPVTTYRPPTSFLPASYNYSTPYTVNLNGSLSAGSGWNVGSNGCNSQVTIQGFNWNGGHPSGGGGGWINIVPGTSNLTIQNNYAHGTWSDVTFGHGYDALIYMAGTGNQTPIDSNVKILWNVFGDGASDCNPLMNLTSYQGGSMAQYGGNCSAVGVQVSTTNLVLQNNVVSHLEQGFKFFSGGGQNDITHTQMLNNSLVDSNDFVLVHRIPVEGQMMVVSGNSTGGVMTVTNNSMHDFLNPNFGTFGLSLPMCCSGYNGYSTNDNQNNPNNNVMIANNVSSGYYPGGLEWWSTGISNNNLYQGWWGLQNNGSRHNGVVQWGFSNFAVRTWSSANNIFQFATSNGLAYEIEESNPTGPTLSNNTTTTTIAARASVTPSIFPLPGAKAFPLTVTLNDIGYTSGLGPLGHTGIWYTTDNSNPVPGAGTAKRLDNGGTFIIPSCSGTCTVKAVGMWGALNQPPAYPANYGFVPSSVVSAAFTGSGGGATLTSITMAQSGTSCTVTGNLTVTARCFYSNSTNFDCTTPDINGSQAQWSSSNSTVAPISSTGTMSCSVAGTSNVFAFIGAIQSTPPVTFTVNPAVPKLSNNSIGKRLGWIR